MRGTAIEYERLLVKVTSSEPPAGVEQVTEALFDAWRRAYRKMTQSPTCFQEFIYRDYRILLDRPSLLVTRGVLPIERAPEDRIVVACGLSHRSQPRMEPSSFLGEAASWLGASDSRPYLPGEVLGTSMDVSLYPLHRNLRRERSVEGRAYRAMQRYCADTPGTFCFSRPIYGSRSWSPTLIEHGLLKQDGTLWVRQFHNGPNRSLRSMLARGMPSKGARSSGVRSP